MNQVAIKDDQKNYVKILQSSIYPNSKTQSVMMVVDYCRAAGLDPLQKPVHIVPMWDSLAGEMRDVIMPGIGLYRVQAARAGCVGISEPEFGPDVVREFAEENSYNKYKKKDEIKSAFTLTYPAWCKVTVKRVVSGVISEFTAVERWTENYATASKDSAHPNAMWTKRPYAQLAKCAEAQALRKGFPEIGSQPTAEEMEGKVIEAGSIVGYGSISATQGAMGRIEHDLKLDVQEIGKTIQNLFNDGNEYGAYEEYTSLPDSFGADEKTALWALLDSKCRTSLTTQRRKDIEDAKADPIT